MKALILSLIALMSVAGLALHTDTQVEKLGANLPISGLTAGTSLDDADLLVYVDNSGTPTTKKITVANATSSQKTFFDTVYQTLLVNSAGLLAALSDETGTGVAVFGTGPTISGAQLTSTPTLTDPVLNGTITGTGVVGISQGGTGSTTKNDALNALLPDQSGNSGKSLVTDGTNATFTGVALPSASGAASTSPLLTDASENLSWGDPLIWTELCSVTATTSSNDALYCAVPTRNYYKILFNVASSTSSTIDIQFNNTRGTGAYTVRRSDNGVGSGGAGGNGVAFPTGYSGVGEAVCKATITALKGCAGTAYGTNSISVFGGTWDNSTTTAVTSFGFFAPGGLIGYGTDFRIYGSAD